VTFKVLGLIVNSGANRSARISEYDTFFSESDKSCVIVKSTSHYGVGGTVMAPVPSVGRVTARVTVPDYSLHGGRRCNGPAIPSAVLGSRLKRGS
jgi:hypothetical protein